MSAISKAWQYGANMKPKLPHYGTFTELDLIQLHEQENKLTPPSEDCPRILVRDTHYSHLILHAAAKVAMIYKHKNEEVIQSIQATQLRTHFAYFLRWTAWANEQDICKALLTLFTQSFPAGYELAIELQVLKSHLEALSQDKYVIIHNGLQQHIFNENEAFLFRDTIHQFLSTLHQKLNTAAIKAKLVNRQNNFKKTNNKCLRLIDDLFQRHSKLLIIRMDFAYNRDESQFQPVIHLDEDKILLAKNDLKLLKKHIKNLLNNRRHNKQLSEILGYILRFEYGLDKGFHVHALFFLNGHKHREDITWGQLLSKYWKQITQQRGCTYICNMNKENYRHCGIGLIHCKEHEKRDNLRLIINYISKTDQFFWFSNLAAARSFQISQLPKAPRSKAGRPRHH